MKEKLKGIWSLLCLFTGVMLVSCADAEHKNPEPPRLGESGYISLQLTTGSSFVSTRTAQDENATAVEQKVTQARWLFYSKDGKLAYSFPIALSNGDGEADFDPETAPGLSQNTPDSPVQFITAAVELKVDDYDMVVLLNPTLEIEARCDNPEAGQTLSGLNEAISIADAAGVIVFTDEDSGFFMSNANGPVPVTSSNFFGDAETAEQGQNPVPVKVDRAIAKVAVNSRVGGTSVTFGTLTDLKWKLRQVNTKMFPYRKYAHFYKYEVEQSPKEVYATSVAASREYIYAEDPNYDGFVADELVEETDDAFTDWNRWTSGTSIPLDNYRYLLENTASSQENTEAFSEVLIYATIENPDQNKTFGKTYYSFNGNVFTHELARTWLSSSFPNNMTGLKAAIDADAARGDDRLFRFDLAAPGGLPDAYVVSPEGIAFHKDGLNQYVVKLKHFGTIDGSTAGTYGYYGVVRNNLYLVTLNTITGPGTYVPPVIPPGPDPDTDTYISADVTILPWQVRENDTILE